ncbi:YlbL family protein [Pseudarthrobacter sp. J1738]|uniref:YlbL family protein n=1 Tax=unclassified Pseudarthrobacter TaxID=2647000 RepID=UPI003D2B8CFD
MTQLSNHLDAPDANNAPYTKRDRRFTAMLVTGAVAVVLGIVAAVVPVPYVVESPGPTFNTLGKDGTKSVISVTGHESYPTSGNLNLTTVYVSGGPNGPVSILEALQAWLDPAKAVYPQEMIYPSGVTKEQSDQESAVAMSTSQENATAAALSELAITYKQNLIVAGFSENSPSQSKLAVGDQLLSVDGHNVTTLKVVQDALAAGAGMPATVVVLRGGKNVTAQVTPTRNSEGRYLLGIGLEYKFTFPFDVKFSLDQVGGPSAGMMFALGLIDTITPGELTGGKFVAGTGTITPDGKVGAIGGIAQKMHGARDQGATLFLAPAANCNDVVGHVPDGLQVVKVETLAEARDAVRLAGEGKDTSALPSCSAN